MSNFVDLNHWKVAFFIYATVAEKRYLPRSGQNVTSPKQVVGDPAPGYTIDAGAIQRLLQLRQDDSEKKLLEAFERLLGVRIEHLRWGWGKI